MDRGCIEVLRACQCSNKTRANEMVLKSSMLWLRLAFNVQHWTKRISWQWHCHGPADRHLRPHWSIYLHSRKLWQRLYHIGCVLEYETSFSLSTPCLQPISVCLIMIEGDRHSTNTSVPSSLRVEARVLLWCSSTSSSTRITYLGQFYFGVFCLFGDSQLTLSLSDPVKEKWSTLTLL